MSSNNIIQDIELEAEDLDNYQNFQEIKKKLDEEGKKEFIFKEGKIIMAGENFVYKTKNGKKIYFYNNSKFIYFSNKKKNLLKKPYFIHDEDSLENALKKTNIINWILKSEPEDKESQSNYSKGLKDSKGSVSSINSLDIHDILKTPYNVIEEPNEIKVNEIFKEERFNKRFMDYTISGLDFNFKYLNEDYTKNSLDYIETQNNWYQQIALSYSNNKCSHCFIFGPKGTGKTTTLLKYLNTEEIPRLYFSLKIMTKNNFNNKKWRKYSLNETIYTFGDKEEMKKFSEKNINDISNSPNLMDFIYSYIKYVLTFFQEVKIKTRKKKFALY